jgi:hypothetical protein
MAHGQDELFMTGVLERALIPDRQALPVIRSLIPHPTRPKA